MLHPCANGLIEKYYEVFCIGIKKIISICLKAHLMEIIGDLLAGLHLLPTKLG